MKRLVILITFMAIVVGLKSQQVEVPYTLADRDRLIQVEAKVDALNLRIDQLEKRIDQLDNRIDQVEQGLNNRIDRLEDKFDTYFTWGFGLVLGAIFALFGFIIYDRRTTLAPVKREQDKILEALRTLGKDDIKLQEALKKVALW